MAATDDTDAATPAKSSKLPLILGIGLALAGGGAGFYAVQSGLILGGDSPGADHGESAQETAPVDDHGMPVADIAFVPIEPLIISLGQGSTGTHLRFRAELEVARQHEAEVQKLMPRVMDVLNSYLRALEVADLSDTNALVRLRAQMLRRVQIVAGADRVNDLLIIEFVLN